LNRYGNDPESLLSTLEARARLFDLLPDAKRAILRLRLEGNKKAEIGALLNRNPGTVETNLLRLRDSLRRKAAEATAAELSPAGGSSARAPQETQSKTPARTPETLRRWTGRLGAMWQAAGLSEGPKGQGAFAASYELLRYWGLTIFTGALTIALGGLAAMPTAPWGVALLVALPAFLGAVALPWVRADFLRAHARVDSGVRRMGNLLTGFYGAAAVAGALGAVLGVHFDAGWINVAGALAATALISIGTAFHARYDAKVIAERTKEAHADVALAAEVERAESPAAKLAVLLPHAESLGLGNSPGDVPLEALRGAFMERTAERVRNTSDYAHALAQALKEIPVGIGIVGNILGGAFGPEMVSLINATSGDKTPVLMPVVGPDELRDFDGLVKTVEDFNNRAETPMVLLPVPADMETAETLRRILAGIPRMAVLGSGDLAAPNIQNDFRAKLKSWKIDESRTAVVASVPKNFAGRITGLDLLERDSVLEEALRNALSLLSRLRDALEILAAVARYA